VTPRRIPALSPWLTSAVVPPAPPTATVSMPVALSRSANETPIRLPIAGRIAVWSTSQVLSRSGTLSVTNSIANITPAAIRTGVVVRSSGTSPNPTRPSNPSMNTVP
jgi:hypothetical protein